MDEERGRLFDDQKVGMGEMKERLGGRHEKC
jgi:hypothetical protein